MYLITKKYIIFLLMLSISFWGMAQDTLNTLSVVTKVSLINSNKPYKLSYKHLVVPAAFIGFGIIGLESDGIKKLNFSTREEVNEHKPRHITMDNYTQYAPTVFVYGLNAIGVKSKHNFKERTVIYGSSQLISALFVVPLKHIVKEERPDGSNSLSFPSGHTATAFSSAQFMFREYKDSNFLLSISGYSFAVFTGVYRIINNKHWVNDVVAGAGFGILSTELAYWLYPKVKGLTKRKNNTVILPFYQNKSLGIGMVHNFN